MRMYYRGDDMKNVIEIENITKSYKMYEKKSARLLELLFPKVKKHKNFKAIDKLSMVLREGDVVGVLGKNGAGKSTLLKIITGVTSQTSGKVSINGKISSLLELGTAFNLELTGYENIYQHGQIMGLTNEEIKAKEKEIIDFADIGKHLYQPVRTYSSGMFARLAFATAINVNPDILIVDEVLSVGDMAFQLKCFKKFEEFKKSGKTIIFVSHNLSQIISNCNRVVVLDKGKELYIGGVKEGVDIYKKLISNMLEDASEKKIEKTKEIAKFQNDWSKHFTVNPDYTEYGNYDAEIIDFGIFNKKNEPTTIFGSEEEMKVKFKVQFNKDIDTPNFSMTIKNFEGQELCGTNTSFLNLAPKVYKKGKTYVCEFTQKFRLSNGKYTLSLSCSQYDANGDLVVLNRNYDLLIFEVITEKQFIGYFDINSTATVKEIKD